MNELNRYRCGSLMSAGLTMLFVACGGTEAETFDTTTQALSTPVSPAPCAAPGNAINAGAGNVTLGSGTLVDSYSSILGPYGGTNVEYNGTVQAAQAIVFNGGVLNGAAVTWGPPNLSVIPIPSGATNLPLGAARPGMINLSSGKLTLAPGNYVASSISINGPGTLAVSPTGPVKIWVTGSLNLGGTENGNGIPSNLTFIVTGSNPVNVNRGGSLYGAIFAPASQVNVNSTVYGSITGSSVTLNSGAAVHYDQNSSCVGGACRVTGTASSAYKNIDSVVAPFLLSQGIANAQFAVSENGTTLATRAYTCPGAIGTPTSTNTMFRLASNGKAWITAAISTLVQKGSIALSTKVFNYLGITTPLPPTATVDPRVFDITVGNLIDHKSGWDNQVPPYFDPTFSMREIANALNLSQAVNERQLVQYMLAQPLQEEPGTTFAYCNFCYEVLAMVAAKASGTSFIDYLAKNVAAPIGVTNIAISPTLEPRLPGEVTHYFSQWLGYSAVNVTSTELVPGPNGGDGSIREVGAGGLATSAESMLKFMDHFVIWGMGPAPGPGYNWARSGSCEGTSTWAEQRADGKRWAFLINTRDFPMYWSNFDTFTSQMNLTLNSLP
jgi:CubicO group peptidase (beta-lactamase class C family)